MSLRDIKTNESDKEGTLYIVATPIGNLKDITQRGLDTLKLVDRICAEDTRNTRKLLTHFGIQGDLQALHDHNERHKIDTIKDWLDAGEQIALVSDAGTPLISDPGYHLVSELGQQGYNIVPIPGVSAIITALSIAGLPTDRFTFEGFLPAKNVGRNKALQANLKEPRTQVYYESSHRIAVTVDALVENFGASRKVVLARELTKMYEQVYRGDLAGLQQWISDDDSPQKVRQKGEFVLMVAGHIEEVDSDAVNSSTEALLKILVDELPVKQAASLASKITGRKKNELYKQAMSLKKT